MAYERQNFQDGNVLSAKQLNHIEDGLIGVSEKVDDINQDIDAVKNQVEGISGEIVGIDNLIKKNENKIAENSEAITQIQQDSVLTTAQTLTEGQKAQARANIDAAKLIKGSDGPFQNTTPGVDGDLYMNTTTGRIYGKVGQQGWKDISGAYIIDFPIADGDDGIITFPSRFKIDFDEVQLAYEMGSSVIFRLIRPSGIYYDFYLVCLWDFNVRTLYFIGYDPDEAERDSRLYIVSFEESSESGLFDVHSEEVFLRNIEAVGKKLGDISTSLDSNARDISQLQDWQADVDHWKTDLLNWQEQTDNDILELQQQQPTANTAYTKLCDRVEITAEDVATAGGEGITCITIGGDNLDLTPYSEILIDFYIPKSDTINTADAGLQISATKTANESLAPDYNTLMRQGSTSITPATALTRQYKMYKTARIVWNNDGKFMYGQLHSGNFGSIGYPAAVAGWPYISESFNKNEKKYFHIFNAELAFKFPAGTWVELYGR